jgi:hypothetical protein
MSHYYGALIA